MKTLLKALSLFFLILMIFSCNVAFAFSSETKCSESDQALITVSLSTVEERDQEFSIVINEIMNGLNDEPSVKGPKYHYKSEYLPYQYVTVSGFAGNQLPGGYRFPSGGGFWYSDNGGPSVSGSVYLNLPLPYNFLSFSVNIGVNSTSGLFVNAPNTTDYFKLYVSKVIEVRPYVIYTARSGTQDWELYLSGIVTFPYSASPEAVKVSE